jgi:bacterioferritin
MTGREGFRDPPVFRSNDGVAFGASNTTVRPPSPASGNSFRACYVGCIKLAGQEHRMSNATASGGSSSKPFLTDVKTLRDRARKNLSDGVVTSTYRGDATKTVEILQSVLATEIVCVLRYTMHAVTATGISSEAIKAEFAQHAKEEQEHMMAVAERIDQLGGTPNFNPEGLASRSASQYAEGHNLVDMIKENLIAERIAVDHYRELIRYFGDDDPATKVMLQGILSVEEEHATDMLDLLEAHQGT